MSEAFLQGSNALWAGDYDSALRSFKELPSARVDLTQVQGWSGSDFLLRAQEHRARQVEAARDQFKRAVMGLPSEYRGLAAGGLPLPGTPHLRGVLFRNSNRHFEMRGYLSDFSWAEQFLQNAKEISSEHTQEKSNQTEVIMSGFSWERPGKLFIETHVSRLGLISAQGFWSPDELPTGQILKKEFQLVLEQLDPRTPGR